MAKVLKKTSNTCLAVVREKHKKGHKGELVFAADRRISWGMSHHQIGVRPKVVKRNGVILAGTGVAYLCDLICELMPLPELSPDTDGFHYMHNQFQPEIKKILAAKGFGDSEGNPNLQPGMVAIILVGVLGELFEVVMEENSIAVDAIDAPYAHGCGGHYALGSLKTTELTKGMSSEKRLMLALGIAAELSPGCDANVDIIRESDPDDC